MKFPFACFLCFFAIQLGAEPLLTSWLTEFSGRYANLYRDNADEMNLTPVTTWSRGQGAQSLPTYAGVHEIASDQDFVYIRTTGLGFHTMGPWYGESGNLFPNYPANSAEIYQFPRNVTIPATKTPTSGGAIGYFIDGVAMFDSRDTFSYSTQAEEDETPRNQNTVNGNDVWERDAYTNEGVTFDPAFAHSAGFLYHYHANSPALRHLVGDSVDYDVSANVYSEAPNGEHSPILGWCRDGLPIYGPYSYSDPTDASSAIRRMISGYQFRDGSNGSTDLRVNTGTDSLGNMTGRTTLPQWVVRNEAAVTSVNLNPNRYGPSTSLIVDNETYSLGRYLQDYAYKGDLTGLDLYEGVATDGPFISGTHYDLNEYNVRFTVTPEFPNGTYAYFINIAADGTPVFPYNIGRYFFADSNGTNAASASPNDIPAAATTHWEGGPEKALQINEVDVDNASGDVTLIWSSVAGGSYSVFHSENLEPDSWQTLDHVSASDATAPLTDFAIVNRLDKNFYRVGLNSITPFDDSGFVYDETLTQPNNVLLLILDDWGLDASELYNTESGAVLANMPHLRSLLFSDPNASPTSEPDLGLLFTRGYAQPICSPTRATMLTGRQPYLTGVLNPTSDGTLLSSELTFPEIISVEAPDYGLASFGKWHLGSGAEGPFTTGGWPHFSGTQSGGVPAYDGWPRIEIENGILTDSGTNVMTYATTAQVNEATSFINAQGDDPWVVWMGFNAPHSPFHDPANFVTPTGGYSVASTDNFSNYIRMLEALDHEIGNLLQAVDRDKTNIIVVGDNGTPGQVVQAPAGTALTGQKGNLSEGGIHVPFFATGPDILQSGTSDKLVHVIDLFSTILDITGVNVESATSGIDDISSNSLLPIFQGGDDADRCIVSEKGNLNPNQDGRAIIMDDWPQYKLVAIHDVIDPNDTPSYQMYEIGSNGFESQELTTPPNNGDAWEDAYLALVAKDQALVPPAMIQSTTVYLRLQTTTGAASPPPAVGVLPTQVTYQNNDVITIEGRLDPDNGDAFGRYWVKVTVDGSATIDTNAFSDFFIKFPNNTNNGNNVVREFEPVEIRVL